MRIQTLRDDDLARIHQASLKVLESTGIWFRDCPEAVGLLEKNGCRRDGVRAMFPPSLVTDCLARLPDRRTLRFGPPSLGYGEEVSLAQGVSHFGLNGNAYYLYDYEKGESRDCVEADAHDKLLITDHLKHFACDPCDLLFQSERSAGGAMPMVYDTAESRRRFLRRWLAGRADKKMKTLAPNVRNYQQDPFRLVLLAHMIRDGVDAAEGQLARWEQYIWINPLSPLQYHPDQTRALLRLQRDDEACRLVKISPEVMMGATAPVTMAGALVQHNAEVLGGLVLTQLARPGTPTMYGCVSTPMDLRNAEISMGNFESALFNAAAVQLADHYGMPSRISPGNTSERRPGVRAAVETAVGLCLGLAAGGNWILTGLLDSTLMISYEHLVVTDEIIAQLTNINDEIQTDAESLAVNVIARHGHPSPEYIYSDHTLKLMKRDIYYSDFCGRIASSYEDWYEKAHRRVQDILARPENEIEDPEILQRLAAVEARLEEDDRTWRRDQDDWWRFYVQDIG